MPSGLEAGPARSGLILETNSLPSSPAPPSWSSAVVSLVFAVFAVVRQRHGQPLTVAAVPAQHVIVTVHARLRQVFQALVEVAAGVGCGQRGPARADYVLDHRGPVEVGPRQAGGGWGKTPGPAGVLLPGCAVWRRKRLPLFVDDGSVGGVDLGWLDLGDEVAVADVEV